MAIKANTLRRGVRFDGKTHFDSLKLGSLLDYVAQSEPFFRDANIAGFDMKSLRWQALNNSSGHPNGIDSRTICTLARYAGISDRTDFLEFLIF